jgi:large conductance mechanosensitive channel
MIKEFRDFLMRGNVIDLAVAVVIGAAFTAVVTSFVDYVVNPLIASIGGQPDFSAYTLGPILIGNFVNAVITFVITALVVFFVLVKPMNATMKRVKRPDAPSTKQCPECLGDIPAAARRCQYCTVELVLAPGGVAD